MHDGAQDDLVGAALHDDLHVALQQARLCEELGLGRVRLWGLQAVRLPLERGTLGGGRESRSSSLPRPSVRSVYRSGSLAGCLLLFVSLSFLHLGLFEVVFSLSGPGRLHFDCKQINLN